MRKYGIGIGYIFLSSSMAHFLSLRTNQAQREQVTTDRQKYEDVSLEILLYSSVSFRVYEFWLGVWSYLSHFLYEFMDTFYNSLE